MAEIWCRSCMQRTDHDARCPACGSTHLLSVPKGRALTIAHVDCDAFYAAIEKRDNPELANVPLIIGGRSQRGVVATACYLARAFGVHSAMPMYKARKLCPHAHILPPSMSKYSHEGERLRAMMRDLTPLMEPLSIDEAFLDLTGTARVHGGPPVQTLLRFQAAVVREIGITVSIGLSCNKFLAKTASDLDKPSGFSIITAEGAANFLADKPVQFIYGVGPAFAKKMGRDGLRAIKQIQNLPVQDMAKRYGEQGLRLAQLARGQDNRKVSPISVRKSISSETTFSEDISDLEMLEKQLWRQCECASQQAKAKNIAGGTAVLKLKDRYHRALTRQKPLDPPTNLADVLFRTLQPSLIKQVDGRSFRLIGAGFSSLCAASDQDGWHDLLDTEAPKRARAERAMDQARARFGKDIIKKGRSLPSPGKKKT
ncbi:MAG: DNA polymerase IV [Robiginitomaculum sp.]|nr:MAG: DNA polymerase IV [Robiginitomaculum sp.]